MYAHLQVLTLSIQSNLKHAPLLQLDLTLETYQRIFLLANQGLLQKQFIINAEAINGDLEARSSCQCESDVAGVLLNFTNHCGRAAQTFNGQLSQVA